MEHTVKIEGVCKKHGSKQILEDISFTARSGRITAFLGPNGAGKSSTLRILLGLDRATAGTATFDGRTYQSMTYPLRTGDDVKSSWPLCVGLHTSYNGRYRG